MYWPLPGVSATVSCCTWPRQCQPCISPSPVGMRPAPAGLRHGTHAGTGGAAGKREPRLVQAAPGPVASPAAGLRPPGLRRQRLGHLAVQHLACLVLRLPCVARPAIDIVIEE